MTTDSRFEDEVNVCDAGSENDWLSVADLARFCKSFEAVVAVACCANPIELIADLRDGFQVMCLSAAISLVCRFRQFPDIAVPVPIKRTLWNHQRVRSLRQGGRAAN